MQLAPRWQPCPAWGVLRAFPALALLAACSAAVEPDPTPEQLRASELAIAVWEARLSPAPDCDPTALTWHVVPPADTGRWCGEEPRACYRDGEITLPDTRYTSETEMLTAHELVHWLGNCSGRWPAGDPMHLDAEVWPAQVEATVEAMRGE